MVVFSAGIVAILRLTFASGGSESPDSGWIPFYGWPEEAVLCAAHVCGSSDDSPAFILLPLRFDAVEVLHREPIRLRPWVIEQENKGKRMNRSLFYFDP